MERMNGLWKPPHVSRLCLCPQLKEELAHAPAGSQAEGILAWVSGLIHVSPLQKPLIVETVLASQDCMCGSLGQLDKWSMACR